jgi:methylenetetrahydrofolate dehydrogenase (NADP+) / methenyltetrahydrofolate cyclohydrolase
MRLLDEYGVNLKGRHAVVLGRGHTIAQPIGMLLLNRDSTVTYCASHTCSEQLATIARSADIVVAAVGKPNFVRGDWIKPGAVVIDAGYSRGGMGDIAFDEVKQLAGLIAPVPGGVGPMTIAVLIEQTVLAAKRAHFPDPDI